MDKKSLIIIAAFLFQGCSLDGYRKDRDFRLANSIDNVNSEYVIIITKVNTNYTIIAPLAVREEI